MYHKLSGVCYSPINGKAGRSRKYEFETDDDHEANARDWETLEGWLLLLISLARHRSDDLNFCPRLSAHELPVEGLFTLYKFGIFNVNPANGARRSSSSDWPLAGLAHAPI